MKKILILLCTVIAFQAVKAQNSFYKHALVASIGFGGDVYSVNETYRLGNTNLVFTDHFGAISMSYPISLEYGIGKRWGIGALVRFDHYFNDTDSITGFQPTTSGVEYGAFVNFHFVRSKHVDMYFGLTLGGSHFIWTLDKYNDQVYGSGKWVNLHLGLRYYFGRFGLFGTLEFPNANYPKLTTNNKTVNNALLKVPASWKATGAAFHLGLQYRFLSE